MTHKTRFFSLALTALTLTLACSGDDAEPAKVGNEGDQPSSPANDEGAPITSALPVACESNDGCPEGVECVLPESGGAVGYCDVEETSVSSDGEPGPSLGAPAPCADDSECPEGIECSIRDGEELGFCNVNEQIVSSDQD